VVAANFVEALLEAGTLDGFLALVSADDLSAIPLFIAASPGALRSPASPLAALPLPWRDVLIRQARQHGVRDGRTRWLVRLALLATVAAAHETLADLLLDELAVLASIPPVARRDDVTTEGLRTGSQPLAEPDKAMEPGGEEEVPDSQAAQETVARQEEACQTLRDRSPSADHPAACPLPPQTAPQPVIAEIPAVRTAAQQPADVTAVSCKGEPYRGEPSLHAGLPFLVPLLQRLDIQECIDTYPDLLTLNLPARVLRAIATRAGSAGDDPILGFLPVVEPQEETVTFCPPSRWDALFPLTSGSTVSLDQAVGAWQVAMARFLRRHARLTLAALVRRPGLVAVTRTHLEVTFPGDQVDLRIRRAGLDLDPGWVPWLGRVVAFHYLYPENP